VFARVGIEPLELIGVNIQALGLSLRRVIAGYVLAAGVVLMSWLCVVSGMIAGCDRCAAG
jgi:hypothetical protein